MVLCCLCLHRLSSAQWVACMRRTAGHLDWAPHIPLSSREPAAQAKTGRSKGWGVGWGVSADHMSLPWLCLIAPSFGHASTSSTWQGNTTAVPYRYLTFYALRQAPCSFLAFSVGMHWSLRGSRHGRGLQRAGGGRRGHYHAFASRLFRQEGRLINGDRAGWAITGILLRLSGA